MTPLPDESPGPLLAEKGMQVLTAFAERFGRPPSLVVRAPGRVNLMGDHTDYNEGLVLPMAIDRAIWIAARPRNDRQIHLYSLDFQALAKFDTTLDNAIQPASAAPHRSGTEVSGKQIPRWAEYIRGMIWALEEAGYPPIYSSGWDGVMAGDVPRGAGLSSSAAVELAVARISTTLTGNPWEPVAMAQVAQHAENAWVGVQCGIMDQLIIATGEPGHAVLIDCRSLAVRAVPLPDEVAVVVLDTATRRGLADSEYNLRRQQCQAAAMFLGVPALRDIDPDTFGRISANLEAELGATIYRRARHVVSENARTLATANALVSGDLREVGRLMAESHASLRDDFEVSRAEIEVMVQLAQGHHDCWGARMTGAGFGGCAVAITTQTGSTRFAREIAHEYQAQVGLVPAVYVCTASGGASIEWQDLICDKDDRG